jgi:hypothetical protein
LRLAIPVNGSDVSPTFDEAAETSIPRLLSQVVDADKALTSREHP